MGAESPDLNRPLLVKKGFIEVALAESDTRVCAFGPGMLWPGLRGIPECVMVIDHRLEAESAAYTLPGSLEAARLSLLWQVANKMGMKARAMFALGHFGAQPGVEALTAVCAASRESMSKAVAALRREGWVVSSYGHVELTAAGLEAAQKWWEFADKRSTYAAIQDHRNHRQGPPR